LQRTRLRSPLNAISLGRTMLNRLLTAAVASWVFSVTLGLWFAVAVSGQLHIETLLLPGVLPVALTGSTAVSLLLTPLAAWSMRTGRRNLRLFTPVLWLVLAGYIVLVVPRTGQLGLLGLLLLAVAGLVVLALIPPTDAIRRSAVPPG
jgi:hypothetical protein